MTNSDPLEILKRHSMTPLEPAEDVADSLLAKLSQQLDASAGDRSLVVPILDVRPTDDNGGSGAARRSHGPMLMVVLSAAALVLVLLGFVGTRLFDDDRVSTDPSTTTTVAPTSTTTTLNGAADLPQPPSVTNARTWQEVLDVRGPLGSQDCVLGGLLIFMIRGASEGDLSFRDSWLEDRDFVASILPQFERVVAAHLDVLRGSGPADQASRYEVALAAIRETIADLPADSSEQADLGSALGPLLEALQQVTTNCPVDKWSVAQGQLMRALQAYGSDAPDFGGMGRPALERCMLSAALSAGFDEWQESPNDGISERFENYWAAYDGSYTDGEVDERLREFVARSAQLQDDAAGVQALAADFTAFRSSEPDGLICPLDTGFGE